ncbi:MAG: membrane protein insertion efficiency factor YidD [Rhodospirillales bacterium]|nr:membrane protein insertion efficiency factor YidD [Rhodospirillales bacterium]
MRMLTLAACLPILAYRWLISPLLVPSCRYQPSCSSYALQAITRFGPIGGGWLAMRRLLRCHPWGGSGDDPVPTHPPFARIAAPPASD